MSVPQQPWPNSGGQRAPGPPPGGPGGPGGPPPGYQRPAPPPQQAPPSGRDGTAMTVLRVITYVLTSIASVLFIVLVIYGMVKIGQLQEAIANSPFGGGLSGPSTLGG